MECGIVESCYVGGSFSTANSELSIIDSWLVTEPGNVLRCVIPVGSAGMKKGPVHNELDGCDTHGSLARRVNELALVDFESDS